MCLSVRVSVCDIVEYFTLSKRKILLVLSFTQVGFGTKSFLQAY